MNITRHNYEEYFMLYADNELSADQRGEVEVFLEANPDLKSEFDLFCALKLEEDPAVTLGDKSFLFRKETTVPEDIQTRMLTYLDGELPTAEAASLQDRINGDASLGKEWEILNRTKLRPDTDIRFPDKRMLYRREAAGARIVQIRWVRYAAAAAVALIAGLLWLNNPEQQDAQPGTMTLAAADSGNGQQPAGNAEGNTNASAGSINDNPAAALDAQESDASGTPLAAVTTPANLVTREADRSTPSEKKSIRESPSEPNRPVLAVTEPVMAETAGEVPPAMAQVSAEAAQVVRDITDKPAGMQGVKTDYATQALAMQDQEEFQEAVYREQDKDKKGFRGLVRKANRIFNKVTNPDLDRAVVKVANVEIGLGR